MAQVQVEIGGNGHQLNCRDGEEAQLRAMAAIVDAKAQEAIRSVGRSSEARTLLFAALLLADDLQEARAKLAGAAGELVTARARLASAEADAEELRSRPAPPPPPVDPAPARALESLAERAEALAARLEKAAARA